MAEILSHASRKDGGESDFSWAEDAAVPWRAVALFGALALVEGLALAVESHGPNAADPGYVLFALAGIVFVGGMLIAPYFGGWYAIAVVAAGSAALLLGLYYEELMLSGAVVSLPWWPGTALEYGGAVVLAVGLVVSILVGRGASRD